MVMAGAGPLVFSDNQPISSVGAQWYEDPWSRCVVSGLTSRWRGDVATDPAT
jgi:hypothetical protein